MKRIYIVMLFAALATITYAQTDDKGYQEGAWVLKGVDVYKRQVPDSMWKTVYLHGMPIRRQNVVMGSITGILTVPLTNTRIRITGIRKAVDIQFP